MKSKLCGLVVLSYVATIAVGFFCIAMNHYLMAQESSVAEKSREIDPLVAEIQKAKYPKLTARMEGAIQGNWVETSSATMALIHKNDPVEKHDPRSVPYVAVYLKSDDGKVSELPYALVFSGGELTLQIPSKRLKGDVRFVTMRRLEELIHAAEQLHNDAK